MSLRSKKRRHARRRRWRELLAIVRETGVLYVASDVWAAMQRGFPMRFEVHYARAAGLEIVALPHLERGTIAAIRMPRSTPFETSLDRFWREAPPEVGRWEP